MANPLNVIQQFQQAIGKGDFTAARQLLQDNLSFRGPIDTFQKPEPYLEALKRLHPIIQRIDMKKIFADGNDVCVLYDMVTNTPAGTAFVCEWYQVKGEKIADVRTVFDARPFAAMFAGKAAT
jgi:limonene-1,2-epoxide hydrolase